MPFRGLEPPAGVKERLFFMPWRQKGTIIMASTLNQIYDELGKVENGGTMVADLQDAIRSAREEAAKSRIERNKVLDKLNLRESGDVDSSLSQLVATLSAVRNAGGDPSTLGTRITDLQKQLKELSDKYDASEKKAKEEHDRRVQTSIRSKLISALTQGKAIKPEEIAKILSSNISMKDDETVVMKDGDKELSLDEGVAAWLKDNAWAVKNDSQPGAGGGAQASGSHKYSMDDLKGMSREEINAHWGEISKGVDK